MISSVRITAMSKKATQTAITLEALIEIARRGCASTISTRSRTVGVLMSTMEGVLPIRTGQDSLRSIPGRARKSKAHEAMTNAR